MIESVLTWIRQDPARRERVRGLLQRCGIDTTDWVRVQMYRECFDYVRALDPSRLDVLEISGGPQWTRDLSFRSYEATQFPGFDVCSDVLPRSFDLIIADQVFEHLPWPYRAGRNVHAMLRPGGVFVVATPFLVRVHRVPIDCSRWTEDGLSHLLQECGFRAEDIETRSWGNRACVKANLLAWRKRGPFASMLNEPDFPVMVWAYARKAPGAATAPARAPSALVEA